VIATIGNVPKKTPGTKPGEVQQGGEVTSV